MAQARKTKKESSAAAPGAAARVAEVEKLASGEATSGVPELLQILRDSSEPIDARLTALSALQAASFSVIAFEDLRGDYLAALRAVADDPDPELRQRVLGILAREKDGFAQKKLLAGLEEPKEALVPAAKALQMLGYDVHTEAYSMARKILASPPSQAAKREALRLLGADATATSIFEKILGDKDEKPEFRRLSAAALQALAPEKLQRQARELLLDRDEVPEMLSTGLTALTQFGGPELAEDKSLIERVDAMRGAASAKLKKSARSFLGKFGG